MHLDSVRFGFACNSSSTHSFIIPDNDLQTDELSDFGWQYFTVAPRDIDAYLGATVLSNFRSSSDGNSALVAEIRRHLGVTVTPDSYVDHQSCLAIPFRYGMSEVDWEYVQAIRRYLTDKGAGVAGGNDNDECSPAFEGKEIQFPGPVEHSGLTSRYAGNQWTLFDRTAGRRFRVRFDDVEPCRPDSPELVDLKITDYCEAGCSYCYQGSTPDGQHAPLHRIFTTLLQLANAKVFEVAIGGGEPTEHPNFREICEFARQRGITPNVTTRNYRFIRDNFGWCSQVLGGIAVSVDKPYTLDKILALRTLCEGLRITVQLVAGSTCWFDKILTECGKQRLPVTLLGFKEQERGSDFKLHDYSQWPKLVREHLPSGFSVDTAFLAKHKAELDDLCGGERRAARFYTLNEGVYSCYIDSVANEIAPSSYCARSLYRPLDRDVIEIWAGMTAV